MSDEQHNIEVEETQDDTEQVEEGSEEESEWTPPGKDDWEKLDRIAKARKKERDDARRELAALKAAAEQSEENDKPDEASKWRETAARSSAAVALQAAGFSGTAKQARRLTRLLDLANIEPDSSGDFDFEEEIEDLKTEFPQLFAKPSSGSQSIRRPTTADRGGNAGGPSGDRMSERLLKAAGYR